MKTRERDKIKCIPASNQIYAGHEKSEFSYCRDGDSLMT